jgi:hypothetical protein
MRVALLLVLLLALGSCSGETPAPVVCDAGAAGYCRCDAGVGIRRCVDGAWRPCECSQ